MPSKKPLVRLKDILTQEVSLVDKAANKRSWVLRKADDMSVSVVPDGKGGFVTQAPTLTVSPGGDGPAITVTHAMLDVAKELAAPAGALSKATKDALIGTIAQLNELVALPDGEADSADVGEKLAKALSAFEAHAEPEGLEALAKAAKDSPKALAKAMSGCGMKLLEIAHSLSIEADELNDSEYSLKWKISDVLDALCTLSSLERMQPAAAAVVASAVSKSDTDTSAHERGKNVAVALQKALYTELHTSEDTPVANTSEKDLESLLEKAETVIKSLKGRVSELEARPQLSNSISVEAAQVTPVKKSAVIWPYDLAAECDEDEPRGSRK